MRINCKDFFSYFQFISIREIVIQYYRIERLYVRISKCVTLYAMYEDAAFESFSAISIFKMDLDQIMRPIIY